MHTFRSCRRPFTRVWHVVLYLSVLASLATYSGGEVTEEDTKEQIETVLPLNNEFMFSMQKMFKAYSVQARTSRFMESVTLTGREAEAQVRAIVRRSRTMMIGGSKEVPLAKHGETPRCDLLSPITGSKDDLIHIVYTITTTRELIGALFTSMNSARANAKHPERLRFYIILAESETQGKDQEDTDALLYAYARDHNKTFSSGVHVVPFDSSLPSFEAFLKHRVTGFRSDLMDVSVWARFFLDDLLYKRFGVDRLIFLDIDVIVLRDVAELWHHALPDGITMAAARTCQKPNFKFFNFTHPAVVGKLQPQDCYINTGVFMLDLKEYAETHRRDAIFQLILEHERAGPIWFTSTQGPLHLGMYGRTCTVSSKWNYNDLGYRFRPSSFINLAGILHWNGVNKPWLVPKGSNDFHADIYWKYALEPPTNLTKR
eukprot:TRINITY_DN14611_c0_g1_i1.p1 TRINITY_DN14611_c0_g1~~TRINITY_DN14611_c0_g1_i1.p1  ORF type:complete len:430 (-),score=55.27 TRINITY_DN14611_c0_g1_i1:61-1350(-)